MRITIKYLLVFAIIVLSNQLNAQEFKLAVGGRLGSPLSASLKTFVSDNNAFEVYAGFRSYSSYRWTSINAAYQKHKSLDDVLTGLRWYVGGGAGLLFWNYDFDFLDQYSNTTISLQGYTGLDYVFEDAPINLTLDWIPTIFIGDGFTSGFGGGFGSLGIRYIIK